jgi:hypothetical protein
VSNDLFLSGLSRGGTKLKNVAWHASWRERELIGVSALPTVGFRGNAPHQRSGVKPQTPEAPELHPQKLTKLWQPVCKNRSSSRKIWLGRLWGVPSRHKIWLGMHEPECLIDCTAYLCIRYEYRTRYVHKIEREIKYRRDCQKKLGANIGIQIQIQTTPWLFWY